MNIWDDIANAKAKQKLDATIEDGAATVFDDKFSLSFNYSFSQKTTSDLAEGSNLYWTTARFNSSFSSKTTTDLAEGTNEYFTPARANSAIQNTSPTLAGITLNGVMVSSPDKTGVIIDTAGFFRMGWIKIPGRQMGLASVNGLNPRFFRASGALNDPSTTFQDLHHWDAQNNAYRPHNDNFGYSGLLNFRWAGVFTVNLTANSITTTTDNGGSIGGNNRRYTDVWAVNGVIQTCDPNNKKDKKYTNDDIMGSIKSLYSTPLEFISNVPVMRCKVEGNAYDSINYDARRLIEMRMPGTYAVQTITTEDGGEISKKLTFDEYTNLQDKSAISVGMTTMDMTAMNTLCIQDLISKVNELAEELKRVKGEKNASK